MKRPIALVAATSVLFGVGAVVFVLFLPGDGPGGDVSPGIPAPASPAPNLGPAPEIS